MTIKTKQMSFEIKSFDADTGSFEGYANVFDNKDHAWDTTRKGAFTNSLAEHKQKDSMPALLWQHKHDQPIGVWLDMSEDEHGLYAKGQLCLETQQGREAHALLKMGALKGLSIGYITVKEQWNDSLNTNELIELNLLECSVVSFPCNELANVEVVKNRFQEKELPTKCEMEKALRELGLSRKQAKAFNKNGYDAFNEKEANDAEKPVETAQLNNIIDAKQAEELLSLIKRM